ncbi:MAG: hypothetical protein ACRDK2_12830, partial [Solirubrobacteraceae bacterium]
MLQALEQSKAELQSLLAGELAQSRARKALEQLSTQWNALGGYEQLELIGPARELQALLARPSLPELLLGRFGLGGFRVGQREAVVAALSGRDCVVVMPTGAGKSL